MEFAYHQKRKNADLLVLPFWKGKKEAESATSFDKQLIPLLKPVLATGDFKGKEGEVLYFYLDKEPEKRGCFLGLGSKEKASSETFRRAYGALTKSCIQKKLKTLNLFVPPLKEEFQKGMIEGLLLSNYIFNGQRHLKQDESVEKVTWIGSDNQILSLSTKLKTICEAVYFARDLINESADKITPQFLAHCAKEIAKKNRLIKATIFDKKRIEKEKMGLLLAVNRGSSIDPAFIILSYNGNRHSKDHTVIIGKGITYDTGGLNLKPVLGSMENMRSDMAGGAACLGIIMAASRLKLKANVTVVIPSTENCIDAKSYKPGDVYKSYSGKTVELTNADAEGRLVLADAISYAVENLHPTRIIDIATLTGAIEIALGNEAAGLMSTDDALAKDLVKAGERTFERVWLMPLFDEYKERLKSDIADIKNWNGRGAGASIAATFLRSFVGETIPWAHLDIAGTAFTHEAKKYLPKYATGFGIRLLIDFLENLEKKGRN